jgi:hypothetical protein
VGRPRIRPPEHRRDADLLWLAAGDPIPPGADRPGHWPDVGKVYIDDPHGAHFFMGPQLGWSPDREGPYRGGTQYQDRDTCTVCGGGISITPGSLRTCAGCLVSSPEIERAVVAEVIAQATVAA